MGDHTMTGIFTIENHAVTISMLAHKELLIRDRQEYIKNKRCTFCRHEVETQEHLFFSYSVRYRGEFINNYIRDKRWSLIGEYLKSSISIKVRHLIKSSMIHHEWIVKHGSMFKEGAD